MPPTDLSMRFGRSVETRQRFGWLDGVHLVRLFQAPLARGRGHCREKPDRVPQHVQAYRGALFWVSKQHTPEYLARAESSSIVDESGEC